MSRKAAFARRFRRRPLLWLGCSGGLVLVGSACWMRLPDVGGLTWVLILTALVVAPYLMAVRNVARATYGSAVAWTYLGLPFVLFLWLTSIHQLGLGRLLEGSTCDPMGGACGVPASPPHWLPFACYGVALGLSALAVRATLRAGRDAELQVLPNENSRRVEHPPTGTR